jgi:hypothetical protein
LPGLNTKASEKSEAFLLGVGRASRPARVLQDPLLAVARYIYFITIAASAALPE